MLFLRYRMVWLPTQHYCVGGSSNPKINLETCLVQLTSAELDSIWISIHCSQNQLLQCRTWLQVLTNGCIVWGAQTRFTCHRKLSQIDHNSISFSLSVNGWWLSNMHNQFVIMSIIFNQLSWSIYMGIKDYIFITTWCGQVGKLVPSNMVDNCSCILVIGIPLVQEG